MNKINLFSAKAIKTILKKHHIRPCKKMGQNFLIDRNIAEKIINCADISKNDIILEIGPGLGSLTQELAKKAGAVIGIEKDKKMSLILKETLKEFKNVKIVNSDILKISNLQNLINQKKENKRKNFKIVANLPYCIASKIIRKFLEYKNPPKTMVLLVQKEVAQRICAKPPKMNLLAVSVQFYAQPEIISYLSKNCFWPIPKIDSAIIKITPIKNKFQNQIPSQLFFRIVKAGFSYPRKQLANNLSKKLKLNKKEIKNLFLKADINPSQRAESLSVDNWIDLTKLFVL